MQTVLFGSGFFYFSQAPADVLNWTQLKA